MADIEVGEIFTGQIETIIRSGSASVKYKREDVTIGPVSVEKGAVVQVKYLGSNDDQPGGYGLCLTPSAQREDYEEFVENVLAQLIPDKVPEQGEITVSRITDIRDNDIGYTEMGGTELCLGPVDGEVDDLVRIEGVSDTHARVITDSARGENYTLRFNILTENYDEVPVEPGDEFTTPITDIEGSNAVGVVREVPIVFFDEDVAIGQVVKGRVKGFESGKVVGEVLEKTDEIRRVPDAGLWARLQWLRYVGFDDEDPFGDFAAQFIQVSEDQLPESDEEIQDALIAEAIRFGVREKASRGDGDWPRVHTISLRHWVVHKLSALFDDPQEGKDREEDGDWFRKVLKEGKGPTMTFVGDLMELSGGFYTPGRTRAIMITDEESVLVSGSPTAAFVERGLDIEVCGVTRLIRNTSRDELERVDIPVQSRESYLGLEDSDSFNRSFIRETVNTRGVEQWAPGPEWEAYIGNVGYQFEWGESALEVTSGDGDALISLWREDPKYGSREYWLRMRPKSDDDKGLMVSLPRGLFKKVALALDHLEGRSRRVEFSPVEEAIRVSCDFSPPREQTRWLHAIGARFEGFEQGRIHWRIRPSHRKSVKEVFAPLAVEMREIQTPGDNE